MGLGATHFPQCGPWSPEHGEDGDACQHSLQLKWTPGHDQSAPQDEEHLRTDCASHSILHMRPQVLQAPGIPCSLCF